jgi:hypothetical protein
MSNRLTPSRRRQQQLARWARQIPGYQFALNGVLPRVRGNAVLSDVAWRVFTPRHQAGHVDVPLVAGRHVSGAGTRMLPVIGVVALGLDEPAATALIDRLGELQSRHASFRPVLLLDIPVFTAARRHGYVLDLVIPRVAWDGEPDAWLAYVAARVAGMIDHYQLWHVAHAEAGVLTALDESLLAVVGERLPGELDVLRAQAASP